MNSRIHRGASGASSNPEDGSPKARDWDSGAEVTSPLARKVFDAAAAGLAVVLLAIMALTVHQLMPRRLASAADAQQSDSVADVRGGAGSAEASSAAPEPDAAGTLARTLDAWPEPRAVLVVTGRQHGYLEPCGCTGLTRQKGGMARRATLLHQLADRGWNVIPLDVGNQVRRFGRQAEIKYQTTIESLNRLGYRAVAWGPDDLRLTVGELVAAAVNDPDLFVSSNVNLLDLVPRVRIIEQGGLKIGVTATLGRGEQQKVNNSALEMSDPAAGLKQAAAEMRAQNCSLFVLLAHADTEETRQLVQAVPEFDLVITAGGAGEPTLRPEEVAGTRSKVIQVGTKGMHAGILGLFDGEIRYQRVALDSSFADDRQMLDALAGYQQQLEALGLEGLDISAAAHPTGRQFVGSETCAQCHDSAYEIWQNSPHAQATADLVHPAERSEVPRHFDPECLSCHVTGWNPQGYYPYASGYLGLEVSQHLQGSGCENCHGPGSEHVAAEMGDIEVTDARQAELRSQMRLPLASAERTCMECHDLDNSPDFHEDGAFERYWAEIAH